MNTTIDNIPDEMELRVFNLLSRAVHPIPIQELAEEIMKDYDYTLAYLVRMGEKRHLRFHDLDDGTQSVELVAVSLKN